MRIAVGGLHSECSTWNPVQMHTADFRILRGADLLAHPEFQPLQEFPVTWLPTLHARAVPGGPIAADTYAAFKAEFLERLAASCPLDGVYLSMHGACFVAGMQDTEGDWLTAVRNLVGPDCPISASYDLHGNVSQRVIDALDMFAAYRTAPHIDVDATKRRALAQLYRAIRDRRRPFLGWVPIPVLLPGERTSTVVEPARGLYARLADCDTVSGVDETSLMVGYVWADEARATASVVVTGTEIAAMTRTAEELAQQYWRARAQFQFGSPVASIEDCVTQAFAELTAPVVLADSGDNPTGGGVGDRAEILACLLARGAKDTLVAGIADPAATSACFQAGLGARAALRIGANLDPAGSTPVDVQAEICFLHDDPNPAERQAVVAIGGVRVVLTARRRPFHEIEDFTRLGLDPRRVKLLVVKSGYLAPALAEIANPNLMMLSPGVVNQDIPSIPIRQTPRPMFPWDQSFPWTPRLRLSARASLYGGT